MVHSDRCIDWAAAPSLVGAGETAGGVIMRSMRREEMCGLLPEVDRIVRWCSVKGGYLRSCQNENRAFKRKCGGYFLIDNHKSTNIHRYSV
jgi:hypothetical protein